LTNYKRDVTIPKHRLNWNFIYDLPFGRGKRFRANSSRLADVLIGGWQIAGTGQLMSRYFQLPTGYIANYSKINYWSTKYPIQDCRSGVCYSGYLLWNGYIPSNLANTHDASGQCIGVCGIPSNYVPFATPLIPWGSTKLPANAPLDTDMTQFWDTNTVWVPLKDGTIQRTDYSGFLDPMQNQFMLGPMQWNMSASMFKTVKLTEHVLMRVNVDFLNNVFNMPGLYLPYISAQQQNSISDGVVTKQYSANPPRVLQLSMRLTW
jgi:hypothetical protein